MAACGGDGGNGDESTLPTATAEAPEESEGGDETPAATATPEAPTGEDGAEVGDGEGDLSALQAQLAQGTGFANLKVTYDISVTIGSVAIPPEGVPVVASLVGSQETFEGTMTIAEQPPDNFMISFTGGQDGQESEVLLIATADSAYSCFAAVGEGTCFMIPVEQF